MKKPPSRLVMPCFKGMNDYDPPPEPSRSRAQDTGETDCGQELPHGMEKVLCGEERKSTADSGSSSDSDEPGNLLRRAKLSVETGDFDSAKIYCEKVLDQDAGNGCAYFYRLMAELQVKSEEALAEAENLTLRRSFELARRYADSELKVKLNGILKDQAEKKRLAEARRDLEREQEAKQLRKKRCHERIQLLRRHIELEEFLHGKSALYAELLRCLDAEDHLYSSDSPTAAAEARVRTATETVMAKAGNLSELERRKALREAELERQKALREAELERQKALREAELERQRAERKKVKLFLFAFFIVGATVIAISGIFYWRDNVKFSKIFIARSRASAANSNWSHAAACARDALHLAPGNTEAKALLERAEYVISELRQAETAKRNFRWDEALKHAKNILEKEPDDAAAKTLIETAESVDRANRGNAETQYKLGERYFFGRGVAQDHAEAVKWYRKAAEQGHAKAQYELGHSYRWGEGVAKDYAEAVKWFRKAAEQGLVEAQNRLAHSYFTGEGVTKDYAEAAKWFRKAAEQGHATSQCELGSCYEWGWGVAKDDAEAEKWFQKAAEQNHPSAREALKRRMLRNMTW